MQVKEVPAAVLMCPRFRFVQALAASIIKEFAGASGERRHFAQSQAAMLAHLIRSVIEPSARENLSPVFAESYLAIAVSLQKVCGDRPELDDWWFPEDGGRQLAADRLDDLCQCQTECLRLVRDLHARKPRRHRHVVVLETTEAA